ncbi:hypothetical protein [uncultured Nonlabens sp.]|uniref:hypothetical protein n=1 Tax=uncultured Nonlabens sp. TaxID=859306 RepID=UPI0026048422|nr:hypothetical protein [uncultured Nonlabens sp.]
MKKLFTILFLLLLSCKNEGYKNGVLKNAMEDISEESKPAFSQAQNIEFAYVNAPSGLNYRIEPKGTILGKFMNGQEVRIVERTAIYEEVLDSQEVKKGEWVGVAFKKDTVYVFDAFLSSQKSDRDIWSQFPVRKTPFIDSTNFDNVKKHYALNKDDIEVLQLKKLYPDINQHDHNYRFYVSYQLPSNYYKTIVLNVFKGDHELESVLIPYDQDDRIIQFYEGDQEGDLPSVNALIITYDDIVEGWSKKIAYLKNDCITVINEVYTDPPGIDSTLYHINGLNEINKVELDFQNNIRPNEKIELNTVYTDTLQFKNYNDDYDYFFLTGIKNDKDISLIYNWDMTADKDFKENDILKVTWKMDSIYTAGDGETLSFYETAIDAVLISN